jgi:chromate reductase
VSIPTIAVLVGSLRSQSINGRLAQALERLATGRARFVLVPLGGLPLYNQDDDGDYPAVCLAFKQQIVQADGVLFVTPEYNRSIPGVLKNAIDIGSRPYGQSAWAGKPAAVCGTSPGATGTAMAQQHLRNVLANLDMQVLAQPEVFLKMAEGLIDADGQVSNPGTATFLGGFVDRFLALVGRSVS